MPKAAGAKVIISKTLKLILFSVVSIFLIASMSACGDSTPTTTTHPAVSNTTTTPIASTTPLSTTTALAPITITGYLTTEDDFAANLGADTAGMVHMKKMAMSGLGITRQKADGKWEFYFFSGNISTGNTVNGTWVFDGTGAQLDAWNIVTAAAASAGMKPVAITVVGVLKGDTNTNPGTDKDGLTFPVITVTSITVN